MAADVATEEEAPLAQPVAKDAAPKDAVISKKIAQIRNLRIRLKTAPLDQSTSKRDTREMVRSLLILFDHVWSFLVLSFLFGPI